MRSRSLVAVPLLGILLVVGIGLRGAPTFSGLRWIPPWDQPQSTAPAGVATALLPPRSPVRSYDVGPSMDLGLVFWVVLALLVVLLIVWLLRRWLRTHGPAKTGLTDARVGEYGPIETPHPPRSAEPDAPALRRGFQRALEVLDAEGEPRDAIVRAWLGLQDAAEDSGILRRRAETSTEFTARILGRVVTDEQAVKTLLRLYLGVRFGDHPVTPADVASARRSLESLAISWRDDSDVARSDREGIVRSAGSGSPG